MEFTDFHEPEEYSAFAFFVAEGVISACGPVLKQGKEACVYRCPTGETTDSREIAVKVYKNIEHRSFKAMSGYLQADLWKPALAGETQCIFSLHPAYSKPSGWIQSSR